MVAHTFDSSAWEAETSRSPRVQSQPGLHREFQASQGYIVRPCVKKTINSIHMELTKLLNERTSLQNNLLQLGVCL